MRWSSDGATTIWLDSVNRPFAAVPTGVTTPVTASTLSEARAYDYHTAEALTLGRPGLGCPALAVRAQQGDPMNKASLLLAGSFFVLSACSSETAAPAQDTGLEGESAEIDAPDTNPYGVAYPTTNLGTQQRSGTKPGNLINNFKFLGYPDGNPANGLQPMSLARFFDPEAREYKILHIQASGVWCVYCQKETEVVTPLAPKLKERKVIWMVSMAEGPTQGKPSTQKDLDGWIAEYKSPFPHVLDPGNKNLGIFYDAAALPWNANINAKTMEILQAGTGAHTTEESILTELDDWLKMLDAGELDLK